MSSPLSILTLLVACNGDDPQPDDTHSGETGTTGTPQDNDGDTYFDCSDVLDWAYGQLCNGKAADCDDNNGNVFPEASEFCDGDDNDCDGEVDEESAVDVTEWCLDNDGDNFGDPAVTSWACESPNGYVDNPDDCDDNDESVNPNQSEVAYNGVDDDCDASTLDDDLDGDGYPTTAPEDAEVSGLDCDDENPDINPNAEEVCDGIDNDCDTQTDEGVTATYFADVDGDTFGDESDSEELCSAEGNYTTTDSNDCDDDDAAVNPAATETCNEIDDDCDDIEDDGLAENTYYADADSDGFGDEDATTETCAATAPSGYTSDATDCDDSNAAINTDGYDVCEDGVDQDCSGADDTCVVTATDADGDGDDDVAFGGGDCDDTNAAISSRATELCDAVDNNCDGTVDEDSAADASTWYEDSDSDGYGNSSSTTAACSQPTGYTSDNTDCDDTTSSVSPAASETAYNGTDDDCDATTPDDDLDGDSYNLADDCDDEDAAVSPSGYDVCEDGVDQDCSGADETCVVTATDADGDGHDAIADGGDDCDDTVAAVNPAATEVCDGVDNDCNGDTDDDDSGVADQSTWYRDADSDSYGSASSPQAACDQPSGYVADNTDFNDSSAAAYPGATEICDEIDNDGDSSTDEGVTTTYYADSDGDSYGDASDSAALCAATATYSTTDATDCNDSSASVNPGATETCNSTDDDCDGDTDEGVTNTYYADGDGDGFGTSDTTQEACSEPTGFVTDATDCDDTVYAVNPAATEECDDEDNDCNGLTDDDDSGLDLTSAVTWHADSDGDGYGDEARTTQACEEPSGYVADDTDCNDASSSINPAATEVCDTSDVDEDCDELSDDADSSATGQTTRYYDGDSDGYGITTSETVCDHTTGYTATNSTDCDDSTTAYYQNLTGYADSDGDGYTVSASSTVCSGATIRSGYRSTATTADCDDAVSSVYPGATETCNSVDDDCDGDTDEGVTTTFYADGDGDGYGVEASTTEACSAPSGYAAATTPFDCDDSDTSIPAASEDSSLIGDEDCDGQGVGNLSDYDNYFDGLEYDYMGFSLAAVGDMTGDGIQDTLVGAPGWTGSAAYGPGYAFLIPGSTTNYWNTAAYTYIEGESSGDSAGSAVMLAGDLDDDGIDDVFVGASLESSYRGSTYLVTGLISSDVSLATPDYEWTGSASYDQSGSDITNAGDFNGDGFDDILIGSYRNNDGGSDAGQAYIELGPVTAGGSAALSTGADVTITGASSGDYFGTSITSADFNGDGLTDIAIGAQHASSAGEGQVYVFLGNTSPSSSMTTTDADSTITGSMASGEAGSAVFASDRADQNNDGTPEIADLDGDGLPDLVIGERYNNCNGTDSGAIYVVNNPLTTATLNATSAYAYICGEYDTELGDSSYAIDAADQDGDGEVDLLLGSMGAGRAYLFRGPVSGVMDVESDASQILEAESTGAYAGRSAKFLGDMDSDGYLEVGVGDIVNDAGGGAYAGTVYIISGDRLAQ